MSKDKNAETDEGTEKGGGKKKLLLILAVVVLAAAGAALLLPVRRLRRGRGRGAGASGTYVALEPVAVNLAGGGYLKIGVRWS